MSFSVPERDRPADADADDVALATASSTRSASAAMPSCSARGEDSTGELVAAEPRGQVAGASSDARRQSATKRSARSPPGCAVAAVLTPLEVVDVEHQQPDALARGRGTPSPRAARGGWREAASAESVAAPSSSACTRSEIIPRLPVISRKAEQPVTGGDDQQLAEQCRVASERLVVGSAEARASASTMSACSRDHEARYGHASRGGKKYGGEDQHAASARKRAGRVRRRPCQCVATAIAEAAEHGRDVDDPAAGARAPVDARSTAQQAPDERGDADRRASA